MQMKKNVLFLIFLVYSSIQVFCQTSNNDEVYLRKTMQYKGIDNDSLLYYSKKLQLSENLCFEYKGKICEALYLYNQEDYNASEEIAVNILSELKNKNDYCFVKLKIESLNRLFWIKKNQHKFNSAFEYLLEIKESIKKVPIDTAYYNTLNNTIQMNMAIIKSLLGHHEEAIKILKTTLNGYNIYKYDLEEGQSNYTKILNQASAYNLIAESYLNSSLDSKSTNLDSASVYNKKAFDIAKTFNPIHENSETLYQLRQAEVLIAKKKFTEALLLIQKYDSNSELFKTTQNINSLKTICFYQLKNNDSTLYFGRKFLKTYTRKPNIKKRLISIYDILANQYYKNKQIDSAYKYSELTIAELNILNKDKNEVNKAQYLYNYKNAQELNKIIIKKEKGNKDNFIITILFILLIGMLIFYFLFQRNKKIKNDLIEAKIELEEKPSPQKTEYNLDQELENTLLKEINDLEKSKDYLDSTFNIHILAKKLNTNTSYLSYLINREHNQSFKQYITKLRIKHLIKKLNNDSKFRNYTIKSLAEEIGYTNASAFTRAFKKHKGITPSEFIKTLK